MIFLKFTRNYLLEFRECIVLSEQLNTKIKSQLKQHIKNIILQKYDIEQMADKEYKEIEQEIKTREKLIYEEVIEDLKELPAHNWKHTVSQIADDLLKDI